MIVRLARAADVEAIRGIVDRAYSKYLGRIGRPPEPLTADYAQQVDDGRVYLAEIDTPIGVIVLTVEPGCLFIENVAVDPLQQGRGVGRAMLEFAEGRAADLGLERLRLYTNVAMTESLSLYLRLGYTELERGFEHGFHRVYLAKRCVARGGHQGGR